MQNHKNYNKPRLLKISGSTFTLLSNANFTLKTHKQNFTQYILFRNGDYFIQVFKKHDFK